VRRRVLRRLLSVRARAAGAAALAAALVFCAGALWMRHAVYEDRMYSQERLAKAEATDLSSIIALTGIASASHPACAGTDACATIWPSGPTGSIPYAVVTDGRVFGTTVSATDPITADGQRIDRLIVEASGLAPASKSGPLTSALNRSGPGYDLQVWSWTREYAPLAGDVSGSQPASPHLFTLYVFVTSFDAEQAVADLDRTLWPGVALAVLLVGLIAWLVTGWSLRPVEAIRSEMAEITARALHRRVPVPSSGDEITRLAATTNETLDRLERAQERQQRFIADASHELRSPIANLRTGLEVALTNAATTDWPAVARGALADAERLGALAADLLLLARLDGGEPLPEATVDIADLARSCVAVRRRADARGPHVTCRADAPALVTGSAAQLGRMLGNLLDNAVRHARAAVTVTVRPGAEAVIVEVEDDGPGVPAADRERVFERFARLDDARSRDAGGVGLGLPIARDVVVRHGGTLAIADSPAGTRLVATLPVAPAPR